MPLDQDLIDLVDDEKFHSHRLGQLPATDDLDHSTLKEHDFQSLLDIGCQGLVQLGCHKKAFMDQLNIDLLLLEQNNFMDYRYWELILVCFLEFSKVPTAVNRFMLRRFSFTLIQVL